jgi:hypothetical protein
MLKNFLNIHQTGFLKLNFEIIPKNCIFRFSQKFFATLDEVGIFLPIFKSGAPRGLVVTPQNVKKVKITAPYWTPNTTQMCMDEVTAEQMNRPANKDGQKVFFLH